MNKFMSVNRLFNFTMTDATNHRLQLFYVFRWFYALVILIYALMSFLGHEMGMVNYFYWVLITVSVVIFNISTKMKMIAEELVSEEYLLIQSMFDYLMLSAALYQVYFFDGIEAAKVEFFFFPLVLSLLLLNTRQAIISFVIFLIYQLLFALLAHGVSFLIWKESRFFSMVLTSSILCSSLLFIKIKLSSYEKRLRQMTERSYRAEHLKLVGAMTAGFCHEMATPINSIKMNLERLKNKEEYLHESVEIGLESVLKIEKTLYSLNEINKNKLNQSNEVINIFPIIKTLVVELGKPRFEIISSEEDFFIESNSAIFTKVMFDLLLNAIEASSDNEKISIFLGKDNDYINLVIKNHGSLFPEFVLNHFGEPFVTAKLNGNGLGLFNAYNYAMGMEGELLISNEMNSAVVELKLKGIVC